MEEFTCKNKRCKAIFYTSEDKKIILCPVCNAKNYNMKKIFTQENFFYIETMLKNIETYGENTFAMIDKVYHNAETRARVRKLYFDTLEVLK